MFEDDFEVFFCVLNETFLYTTDTIFQVTVHQITEIKPLSEKIIPILKQKLGDFKISTPVDKSLYEKLHNEKLKKISFDGLNYIQESFSLLITPEIQIIFQSLISAKAKSFFETSSEKDSWFDFLISYERAKPYPIADIGFLYDVGAIYRERFNITDDDIANREILKTQDLDKYELISHIVELSKFLQTANQESPFSSFLKFYETSVLLKVSNTELHQKEIPETLNHILLYAFFFKFRKLIRDTNDLTEIKFISQVERFLKGSKEEATIALLMCGIMFGSLKLKELYYASKLLVISSVPTFENETIQNQNQNSKKSPKLEIEVDVVSHHDIRPHIEVKTESFDDSILFKLSPIISSLHKSVKKSITDTFNYVRTVDKELTTTKTEYFIRCLYMNAKKELTSKNKNKLTNEIVDKIKELI
ncbi:MAG: hypothetical protein IPG95_01140 [Saprospiraceae bacterium]|nr:hypothetical protein [Saprospiraceae bacterium]